MQIIKFILRVHEIINRTIMIKLINKPVADFLYCSELMVYFPPVVVSDHVLQ